MRKFTWIPIIIACLSFAGKVNGQATISSPYSDYGVGLLEPGNFAFGRSMGGISQGLRSPVDINIMNPASYSAIRLTTFEAGLFGGVRGLSKGDISQTNHDFGINYISLAFPVSSKWGSSIGLLPFSNVGYRVMNESKLDTTNVSYINTGEGGLSQFYIGNSYAFSPNFSVGMNVAYLFGNIEQTWATEFPDNQFLYRNSKVVDIFRASGFRFTFGIQGGVKLSDNTRLTYGYTGTLKTNLTAHSDLLRLAYNSNQETEVGVDTTEYTIGAKNDIHLPASHQAGFTINNQGKWLFGADISYSDWTDFSRTSAYQPDRAQRDLGKSIGLSAGVQYIPDPESVSSYFKLMNYRAGFKYRKMPININGKDISETSISLGFGMPFLSREMNSYGKFNLGVELGQRGTNDGSLIKEQFAMFNVGITYSTRWFIKRQFD